jgi:hypothetical protein
MVQSSQTICRIITKRLLAESIKMLSVDNAKLILRCSADVGLKFLQNAFDEFPIRVAADEEKATKFQF